MTMTSKALLSLLVAETFTVKAAERVTLSSL